MQWLCSYGLAQADTLFKRNAGKWPEVLNAGFMEVMNNGQVNTGARFIHLYIGEPGRLVLPLSVYGGAAANYFQNPGARAARTTGI